MVNLGNTLIVVEHDEDTMREADYIVDVGPGAGIHGGEIVAAGTLQDIIDCPRSITGQYLSGVKKIPVPNKRRPGDGRELKFFGCAENNLKNIDVSIPLGTLTVVTGVSGSGKSSLVNEIIYKKLAAELEPLPNQVRKAPRLQRALISWTRSSASTRAPLAAPPAPILPLIRACSAIFGICSPPPPRPRQRATAPDDSPLTSRADAARPAPATVW